MERHRPLRDWLIGAWAVSALAYLFIPIAVVIAFSFNDNSGRFNITWEGFTLDHWTHPFAVEGLGEAFRKVTLPLALPGILAGSLLTFIPAVGDFIYAQLLGTSRQYMIGNVIQSKFLVVTDYPAAAALSFLLMAALLLAVFAYARALGARNLEEAVV